MPSPRSRFYALAVPEAIELAITERLTDWNGDDLIAAHLKRNPPYFGGIDKTLSGFVILADKDDDYILLDQRGSGGVYQQDHEDRSLSFLYDDGASWLTSLGRSAEGCPSVAMAERQPTTLDLLDRYQWLVWLLATQMTHDGAITEDVSRLARVADRSLGECWSDQPAIEEAFASELPLLRDDPHLAIYWLLHAAMLAEEGRSQQILAALPADPPPLLQAFVAAFGRLSAEGDVPAVADFRARRGLAVTFRGMDIGRSSVDALLGLRISPTYGLFKAAMVVDGLADGSLDPATVRTALAGSPDPGSPGVAWAMAAAVQQQGEDASVHADALVRRAEVTSGSWPRLLRALWQVRGSIRDGVALAALCDRLLDGDPHHPQIWGLARLAAGLTGGRPVDRELALAEASEAILTELLATPDTTAAIVQRPLPGEVLDAVARRLLHRGDIDKTAADQAAWAVRRLAGNASPEAVTTLGVAMLRLPTQSLAAALQGLSDALADPAHPVVGMLVDALIAIPGAGKDPFGELDRRMMTEAVFKALVKVLPDPAIQRTLLRGVTEQVSRVFLEKLGEYLLRPFDVRTAIGVEESLRLVRVLVALGQRESVVSRHLGAIARPETEPALCEAVTDISQRYGELVAGGSESAVNELVAELYQAIAFMLTPSSRRFLAQRLRVERQELLGRLNGGLGRVLVASFHGEFLAELEATRDVAAAARYAFALVDRQRPEAFLIELATRMVAWPSPAAAADRSLLRYVLGQAIKPCLTSRLHDAAKPLIACVLPLSEAAVRPDGWPEKDPTADPEFRREMEFILADGPAKLVARARASVVKRRAKGTPYRRTSDELIECLCGKSVQTRLLVDRTSGEMVFRDSSYDYRYFDGYDVVEAPFLLEGAKLDLPMHRFFAESPGITDRFMAWDKADEYFREVICCGDRLMLVWGLNNGHHDLMRILARDRAQAETLMRQFRDNLPTGYRQSSPFYLAGRGAIVRTYGTSRGDGKYDTRREAVLDSCHVLSKRQFASPAEAEAAYTAAEFGWLCDPKMRKGSIEWMDGLVSPSDRKASRH